MTMKASSYAGNSGPRPSDRWIPWYFVLFFAVVASVLGFFTYLALRTDPGLVTKSAYQKGLQYDRIIEAADQGNALPWQAEIDLQRQGEDAVLQVGLKGIEKDVGKILLEAWLLRPAQEGKDQHWPMRAIGQGKYEAKGKLQPGQWNIHVTALIGGKQKQFFKAAVVR